MNAPANTTHVDNTDKARELIMLGLALDPDVRSTTLARLIAATLHGGPDTALCLFAGTGHLDPQPALTELMNLTVPLEHEGWVDALGHYILRTGGKS